jgi:radical SAM superfamily enzyme YgiQ (UPF0313 family)
MDESRRRLQRSPTVPADMAVAPVLGPAPAGRAARRHLALLVNPFYAKDPRASYGKHVLTPTLALTSIAGATPAHWEVRYWDENLLQGPPPDDPLPQVVGITVHLTFARRAYELAAWYRAQGSLVVLGGLHVLSCPQEALGHADAIAVGDGVSLWPEILDDIERGTLRRRYDADYSRAYALDPPPRRSMLPRDSFLTTTSVIATRGCHNRCGFCYLSTDGLHMPYRMREVEQVVAEIIADRQPYAVFVDNNLGSRPAYLRQLCAALQPLQIIWSAAVTIDVTDDPLLIRDMARAGCTGVFVGFESLNGGNLSDARKRTPAPADYARRVALLHRYGIQVNGSFVLGFDHDRADVFERTVEWIEENRLECATFHILTPYPGTPLFRQLDSQGRILHRDWDKYDTAHVVFRPKHMTCGELDQGYAWCYDKLFSHRSIWRRQPADRQALLAYLAMSYLYKRSNRFWHLLIRHRLTGAVWRPLIEHSRRRHLKLRPQLERLGIADESQADELRASQVVSAGV